MFCFINDKILCKGFQERGLSFHCGVQVHFSYSCPYQDIMVAVVALSRVRPVHKFPIISNYSHLLRICCFSQMF